jgi:hypothetical protein
MSAGEHTLIMSNYMDRGLNAPALWRSANSSWGPMGIHINIGNHEVSYNTIKNYGTTDSPWGSDGGAIEIDNGNYHKQNIYIHHNYSEGNAGFIESSWDYDWPRYAQEVHNWRVSFNVCYDGQSWLFMLAPCTGVSFDNNTIARYNAFGRSQDTGARMDVTGGTPVGVASGAHFRNNLFVYTSSPYEGNRAAGALKTKNWYYRKDQPGTVYGGDGNPAGNGDPKIVNLGNGNYNLTAGSSLRGAGVNLSATYPNAVDFNGQALPASGSWDIGAMQFLPTADYDNDGMADGWEFDHGLNISSNDAAADNDGDGASNYAEYLADTNPTNTLSRFHIESITKNATGFAVSFASSASRRYTLYHRPNLDSGSWMNIPTQTDILGSGGVDTLTDPSPTGTQRFYRVGVSLP